MRWQSGVACGVAAALLGVAAAASSTPGAGAQDLRQRTLDPPPGGAVGRAEIVDSRVERVDSAPELLARVHVRADAPLAAPVPSTAEPSPEPARPASISVGRHNAGRLLYGRELVESEHVRLKNQGDQHYGTDEFVELIERAAGAVASEFPGSRLTVGDLSRRRGGVFRPHRSHRSGRDADIGFYLVGPDGEMVYEDRFLDVRPDGTVRARGGIGEGWRFDDARNWALVAALVGQDEAPVQYMFVARWLRQRLLDHAARIGAAPALIERAAAVLDQPSSGGRHEDHFHTRIYCPRTDRPRCVDEAPWHPWVARPSPDELAALRVAADRERASRARDRRHADRRHADRRRQASRHRGRPTAEPAEPVAAPAAGPPSDSTTLGG